MLAHRIRGTDEKDIILKSKIQNHGRVPGIHSPIGGPGRRRSLVLGVSKRGYISTLTNEIKPAFELLRYIKTKKII